MKVKKYVANTMPEAMEKIRADFGSDAVILNSKEIKRGGFLGLFKKGKIEVIAAYDPEPRAPSDRKPANKSKLKPTFNKQLNNQEPTVQEDVLMEIKHMKKLMEQQASSTNNYFPPDYEVVFNYLLDQEVNVDLAKQIITSVVERHKDSDIQSTGKLIVQDTENEIKKRLAEVSFEGITYDSQIVQFIGPTGVGKTTTLAKIAAFSMLKDKKTVAFITADTYRIAAIEQLKTYAQILNVPIEVAYTSKDFEQAIEKFSTYDLILVDHAGRNFREKNYVDELRDSLKIRYPIETYLVLSLSAKPKDITEIYDQFDDIPIKQVIFTKIDETTQYGSLLNIALDKEIGIAYLTDGQDVPEDLVNPNPEKIKDLVMGEYYES